MQGPIHPELKIAMDMSIQMKTPSGVVCTLALSFNNNGPLGTWFRYICDNGTYIARYDELVDGYDKADRCFESRCVDGWNRTAGSRIHRGHPGKTRTQFQCRAGTAGHAGAGSPGKITEIANGSTRHKRHKRSNSYAFMCVFAVAVLFAVIAVSLLHALTRSGLRVLRIVPDFDRLLVILDGLVAIALEIGNSAR